MKKKSSPHVLLGDVVASRNIENRKQFEKKINSVLQWATARYSNLFTLPLKTWKGLDEIAAVVIQPQSIYPLISGINERLYPQQMRFVLAKGEIEKKRGATDISQLDGEAFHKASALMAELKKENFLFKCSSDGVFDTAFNNQVNAVWLLKARFTEKQMKIYSLYAETANQEEVAVKLKITQQTVSKTMNAINGFGLLKLEKNINDWVMANYN